MKKASLGMLGALWVLASLMGPALAAPKLGVAAPDLPLVAPEKRPERYLVALYSHDCGDISALWSEVLGLRLPVYGINAEGIPTPAPNTVPVLGGDRATDYARTVKVTVYPTLLLIEDGVVVGVWESGGTGIPESLGLPR